MWKREREHLMENAILTPTNANSAAVPVRNTSKFSSLPHILLPYLLVAPAMVVLFVFLLYPIGYMVYLSFFNWNMIRPMEFVGLQNFTNMFQNPEFIQTLLNTLQYTVFTLLFGMGLAILAALFLKENTRLNHFLQATIFLPYVMPLVSVTFIFLWLMDTNYGLFNFILQALHLPAIDWLGSTSAAMPSLILVSIWKSVGYNTLIILSAMQAVPQYLYEAARLDQASGRRIFFRITLPMISPSLFFLTLMNLIACFKVFETVNLMTAGGPVNATTTLVYSIYQYGFRFYKLGYASAEGIVLMIIIGICTLLYFGALSRRVYYR